MNPRFLALILTTACAGTASTDTSDTTADTGTDAIVAENGLPEGESTWSGQMVVSGIGFPVELSLTNTGGDLSGIVDFSDNPDSPTGIGSGRYSVTGTHEPISGRVAIAPLDWIEESDIVIELVGFSGTYDPDALTLTGTVADYASGTDNTLSGGAAELVWVSGDGAPTAAGSGDAALQEGTRSYSGTHQCSSAERELVGELTWDGVGDIEGTITFGDYTLQEGSATFAFTGVHNPTTGGMTLVPGLYEDTDPSYLSFFVEATYDPDTDAFPGEGRVGSGGCVSDGWKAAF